MVSLPWVPGLNPKLRKTFRKGLLHSTFWIFQDILKNHLTTFIHHPRTFLSSPDNPAPWARSSQIVVFPERSVTEFLHHSQSCLVFLLSHLDYPDFTQLKNRASVCNKWDLQCQQNIRLTLLTIRLPHLSKFRLATSDKNLVGDQSSRIFCGLHLSGNVLGPRLK